MVRANYFRLKRLMSREKRVKKLSRLGESEENDAQKNFIEQTFQKRECCQFVASSRDKTKCGCGRTFSAHHYLTRFDADVNGTITGAGGLGLRAAETDSSFVRRSGSSFGKGSIGGSSGGQRWSIASHTIAQSTDAYGTIEFLGGPHPHKAHFARLGFDSEPDQILYLFEQVWGIERPKLVISVHGGIANFSLQPKLARVFRKGLLKAAKTTGAWIITSGLNAGVVRHVASALGDGGGLRSKKNIVTIGIAPWGLLKKRDDFIGKETIVPYHPQAFSPKGRFAVLNDKHSYFLLVDNGTVGRYGADIILRKRFEEYVSKLRIESSGKRVPVVCVVVEGGTCTIRAVLDYVTNVPPVPVVICDGSGRAADLLAFTHKFAQDDGTMPDSLKDQLLLTIEHCFEYNHIQANKVFMELMLCVRKKHLITVFRLGEDSQQDIDHAILTALLKGQDLSAPDQLSLALTWNRPDIARSDIFVYGQDWPPGSLESAMMDALIYDRVEFVKLLLENGISMEKFLSVDRLEHLYNTDKGPTYSLDALKLIVRDVVKYPIRKQHLITLYEIGLVMQKLMGGAYRAQYCRKDFRRHVAATKLVKEARLKAAANAEHNHVACKGLSPTMSHKNEDEDDRKVQPEPDVHFKYPFNELLVWAVMLRRQKMALCMWQHGEEALAKALVAMRMYKSMANEAAEDYLEVEICEELNSYSQEFCKLGIDLLEHCYATDDDQTFQLLTYELHNWGNETCLSLAYLANHMEFVAHPGCQILLADLWHGGLRIRRNSNLRVLMGLLCPLTILTIDFKTKEELLLQPQTKEEYIEVKREGDRDSGMYVESSNEASCDNSTDSSSESDGAGPVHSEADAEAAGNHRRSSESSNEDCINMNPHDRRSSHHGRRSAWRGSKASLASSFLRSMVGAAGKHNASYRRKRTTTIPAVTVEPPPPNESHIEQLPSPSATLPPATKFPSRCSVHLESLGAGSKNPRYSIRQSATVAQLAPSGLKSFSSLPVFSSKGISSKRTRPLKLGKKFYEFYVAPITTFWSFVISYGVFLTAFTFIVLKRTPVTPEFPEYFVIIYMFTYGCELVRKLLLSDSHHFTQKLIFFARQRFNLASTLAVLLFGVAVCLRFNSGTRAWGRVLYACDITYWYIYTLDLLSVNKYLGPYIMMMAKMLVQMLYITTILAVVLMSFGVVRQSILFPEHDFHWQLVRNIFYKPYFMLYGEVYAPEIDTCGDRGEACVTGGWLTPIFMAVFLLVANILLINLLIAAFNNTFQEVNAVSQQVWKYQRYYIVMEYEQKPWLPPPLILIPHMHLIYKYCCQRGFNKSDWISDIGLKLFLLPEDVEKLHDFEEECMDEFFCQRDFKVFNSQPECIKRTSDKVEFMSIKLDDLMAKYNSSKLTMQLLETKIRRIEEVQTEIFDAVHLSQSIDPGEYIAGSTDEEEEMAMAVRNRATAPSPGILRQSSSPSSTPTEERKRVTSFHQSQDTHQAVANSSEDSNRRTGGHSPDSLAGDSRLPGRDDRAPSFTGQRLSRTNRPPPIITSPSVLARKFPPIAEEQSSATPTNDSNELIPISSGKSEAEFIDGMMLSDPDLVTVPTPVQLIINNYGSRYSIRGGISSPTTPPIISLTDANGLASSSLVDWDLDSGSSKVRCGDGSNDQLASSGRSVTANNSHNIVRPSTNNETGNFVFNDILDEQVRTCLFPAAVPEVVISDHAQTPQGKSFGQSSEWVWENDEKSYDDNFAGKQWPGASGEGSPLLGKVQLGKEIVGDRSDSFVLEQDQEGDLSDDEDADHNSALLPRDSYSSTLCRTNRATKNDGASVVGGGSHSDPGYSALRTNEEILSCIMENSSVDDVTGKSNTTSDADSKSFKSDGSSTPTASVDASRHSVPRYRSTSINSYHPFHATGEGEPPGGKSDYLTPVEEEALSIRRFGPGGVAPGDFVGAGTDDGGITMLNSKYNYGNNNMNSNNRTNNSLIGSERISPSRNAQSRRSLSPTDRPGDQQGQGPSGGSRYLASPGTSRQSAGGLYSGTKRSFSVPHNNPETIGPNSAHYAAPPSPMIHKRSLRDRRLAATHLRPVGALQPLNSAPPLPSISPAVLRAVTSGLGTGVGGPWTPGSIPPYSPSIIKGEYTTITDCIDTSCVLEPAEAIIFKRPLRKSISDWRLHKSSDPSLYFSTVGFQYPSSMNPGSMANNAICDSGEDIGNGRRFPESTECRRKRMSSADDDGISGGTSAMSSMCASPAVSSLSNSLLTGLQEGEAEITNAAPQSLTSGGLTEPKLAAILERHSPPAPEHAPVESLRQESLEETKRIQLEQEEYTRALTGGLLHHRLRKNSEQIGLLSPIELQDMGLSEFELDDYRKYFEPAVREKHSSSSSGSSLGSQQLEDRTGFQDITECLTHKEEVKAAEQSRAGRRGSKTKRKKKGEAKLSPQAVQPARPKDLPVTTVEEGARVTPPIQKKQYNNINAPVFDESAGLNSDPSTSAVGSPDVSVTEGSATTLSSPTSPMGSKRRRSFQRSKAVIEARVSGDALGDAAVPSYNISSHSSQTFSEPKQTEFLVDAHNNIALSSPENPRIGRSSGRSSKGASRGRRRHRPKSASDMQMSCSYDENLTVKQNRKHNSESAYPGGNPLSAPDSVIPGSQRVPHAGMVFSFDSEDIETHLRKAQAQQRQQIAMEDEE